MAMAFKSLLIMLHIADQSSTLKDWSSLFYISMFCISPSSLNRGAEGFYQNNYSKVKMRALNKLMVIVIDGNLVPPYLQGFFLIEHQECFPNIFLNTLHFFFQETARDFRPLVSRGFASNFNKDIFVHGLTFRKE